MGFGWRIAGSDESWQTQTGLPNSAGRKTKIFCMATSDSWDCPLLIPPMTQGLAMGQNPNRTPSEHPNIPTKVGSKKKWCTENPPKWDPIGFDHHSRLTANKRPRRRSRGADFLLRSYSSKPSRRAAKLERFRVFTS